MHLIIVRSFSAYGNRKNMDEEFNPLLKKEKETHKNCVSLILGGPEEDWHTSYALSICKQIHLIIVRSFSAYGNQKNMDEEFNPLRKKKKETHKNCVSLILGGPEED